MVEYRAYGLDAAGSGGGRAGCVQRNMRCHLAGGIPQQVGGQGGGAGDGLDTARYTRKNGVLDEMEKYNQAVITYSLHQR